MPIAEITPLRKPAREPAARRRPRRRPKPAVCDLQVKIWPELGRAALAAKVDKELRLWHIARALDARGRGVVSVDGLQQAIDGTAVKGLSRCYVGRLLRAGHGVFWDLYVKDGQRRIALRGLAAVGVALGVERLRRRPVEVALPLNLKGWRALCAFAGFAKPGVMSQATLGGLCDRTDRTVRNWASALGCNLRVQRNVVRTGIKWERGDPIPDGHLPDRVDGRLELVRLLPNMYEMMGIRVCGRGRTKKADKTLKGNSRTLARRGKRLTRTFLHHWPDDDLSPRQNRSRKRSIAKKVARRIQEGAPADRFFYALGRERARSGALIWQEWDTSWSLGCSDFSDPCGGGAGEVSVC